MTWLYLLTTMLLIASVCGTGHGHRRPRLPSQQEMEYMKQLRADSSRTSPFSPFFVQKKSSAYGGLDPLTYFRNEKAYKRMQRATLIEADVEEEAVPYVFWGKRCAPREATVSRHMDAYLYCETMTSPHYSEIVKEEKRGSNEEDLTNFVLHYLHSAVYIDCANDENMGEYVLSVVTPDGRKANRSFSVEIDGEPYVAGHSCFYKIQKPRIYEHSRDVAVPYDQREVILPCRSQGPPHSFAIWYFKKNYFAVSGEHGNENEVLHNGDLALRNFNNSQTGLYTCYATDPTITYIDVASTRVFRMPTD